MWDDIEKYLPMFESAVLNVTGPEGYPYSVRCHPLPDRASGILRLNVAEGVPARSGPASILYHSHDEYTWNQKVFTLRGRLEQDEDGWVFRPAKFVPNIGIGGAVATIQTVVQIRRNSAAYLKKRGLQRPRVAWNEIEAVKQRASS